MNQKRIDKVKYNFIKKVRTKNARKYIKSDIFIYLFGKMDMELRSLKIMNISLLFYSSKLCFSSDGNMKAYDNA